MSSSQLNLAGVHDVSNDVHSTATHHRYFLGPMPEKVISRTEARVDQKKQGWLQRSNTLPDENEEHPESISSAIQDHAFQFFLRQGGHEEDWGENEQEGVRREMLKRWGDSQWGSIWKRRRSKNQNTEPASNWIGGTFEIGNFLGVNIFDEARMEGSRYSGTFSTKRPSSSVRPSLVSPVNSSASRSLKPPPPSTAAEDTFITARSQMNISTLRSTVQFPSVESQSQPVSPLLTPNGLDADSHWPLSTSSTTALLKADTGRTSSSKSPADVPKRAILKSLTSLPANSGANENGPPSLAVLPVVDTHIGKTVHYMDSPTTDISPPAPPMEVLARTGSAVEDSSAGAVDAATQDTINWGDVVMRDRMLVRASYSRSESLGNSFDENQNRMTSHLRYEDWQECIVVWRRDRLEIYEDHSLPLKEQIVGHKHLAFVIPLKTKTKLSLYSFVDFTLCLTCPPTPTRSSESSARAIFHRSKEGTNIFVLKQKSRSRAQDWMWALWRQLGGELPSCIEVYCPAMDSRVKIDLPPSLALGDPRSIATMTRQNIIALCRNLLKNHQDWDLIVERQIQAGKHLELAWRMEAKLDWIWLDDDIDGKRRDFAVLCGLAMKQAGKSPHLEIRLGDHRQSSLSLRDGTKLHEPPAIEGYLDCIRPNTQNKEAVYITSHDGYIFSLTPANAQPPSPPGLRPPKETTETLRQTEVKRGVQQVMLATGVCDVRNILVVRRAFHLVTRPLHSTDDVTGPPSGAQPQEDGDDWLGIWDVERTDSDEEEIGGDEGLAKSTNKPKLRMQRSFELLLKSGRVIRFEAHSRRVALEWIERLRDLVVYWKHRHRVDARQEMDLAQAGSHRPRLTPQLHAGSEGHERAPIPPSDVEAALPALGMLYSWCVLDGCKAVLKSGKLHTRKGLRGHYKNVQLFLVSGHLIRYQITPKSSLHRRQSKKINLLDAYVTSGYFAALKLPRGQYNPQVSSVPRRYQDGLETDDPEEDMLFIVWYRPQAPTVDDVAPPPDLNAPSDIPALSAKRKLVLFKARSKLERDAWCWAINCEIDKLVRAGREREVKLRQTGGLIKV